VVPAYKTYGVEPFAAGAGVNAMSLTLKYAALKLPLEMLTLAAVPAVNEFRVKTLPRLPVKLKLVHEKAYVGLKLIVWAAVPVLETVVNNPPPIVVVAEAVVFVQVNVP